MNSPETLTSRRVLVVDDNVDAADSLGALLEIDGHDVRVAHGGHEALQVVQGFVPEVAFVDIGMPDMDGYALAGALRALPSLAGTTLVSLSGYGAPRDRLRSQASGFDQHLTKPASLEMLYAVLAGLG